MLGLDVQNTYTEGGILMADFWYIVLMTSLAYLTLVLPVGLWYSELDDEEMKMVSHSIYVIFLGSKSFHSSEERVHCDRASQLIFVSNLCVHELCRDPGHSVNMHCHQ